MIRGLRRLVQAVGSARSTPTTRLTFGFIAAARLAILIAILHASTGDGRGVAFSPQSRPPMGQVGGLASRIAYPAAFTQEVCE